MSEALTYSNINVMPIVPWPNDVLCGSSKAAMKHHGNKLFRALVKAKARTYPDSDSYFRWEMRETTGIVNEIEAMNGRFLKKSSDGSWCILGHDEAVRKTAQALRDAKRFVIGENKPEDITVPVNHQRVDDPMQSVTMSTSLQPIISVDAPLQEGPKESKKNQNNEENPSLDDPGEVSSLATSMSLGDMSMVDTPDKLDVLCGGGRAVIKHPGNMEFRRVVKVMLTASSFVPHMKTQISEGIVQHVEACGGRFLKRNTEGVWCPITHSEAVEKTSQALRDAKRLTLPPKISDQTLKSRGYVSMVDHDDMVPSPFVSVTKTNGTTPDKLDVLCGSGKAVMNHPGNVEFRRIVKTMVTCFPDATGHMKPQISESIVQHIEACGGRFLKKNTEGVWCPITRAYAVERTSQALRDAKRGALRQKIADHTPDSSPKRDRVLSAPMPVAPDIPPPSSKKNVYDPTVEEVTKSAITMLSFEPSLDDLSPVVTFGITGNTDSVVETLDIMNLHEQSPLDKTKRPAATEVLERFTQTQTMSNDEAQLQNDEQHPTASKRPRRANKATPLRDLVSGSNIEMASYSQSEMLGRGFGYHHFFDTNEQLGSGAQGNVFKCTSKENGRTFAVKIINTNGFVPRMMAILDNELQLLNQINGEAHLLSPKIVQVFHAYEIPDYTYIVMEHMLGGTLTEWRSKRESCSVTELETRQICRNLFEALDYCHQRGIAHRDIKLGNLVLAKPNDLTSLKIANFGFAKVVPQNGLTTRCGTPLFLPPEIVLQSEMYKRYDTKCDMWSAGVVVYILLGGMPPFSFTPGIVESIHDLYQDIVLGRMDLDNSNWSMVSNEAKTLIKGLLTKDPRKRWSVKDVLECKWMKTDETSLPTISLFFTYEAFDETSCCCLPRFDNTREGNEDLPARSIYSFILDTSMVKLYDRFVID